LLEKIFLLFGKELLLEIYDTLKGKSLAALLAGFEDWI
jgi:hypothetical protein